MGVGQLATQEGMDRNVTTNESTTVSVGGRTFTRVFSTGYLFQFVTEGCYYHHPRKGWTNGGMTVSQGCGSVMISKW